MSGENKILYKKLSYKLQGLLFDIRNDLGSGHKESIYQKALEKKLISSGIDFQKEPAIKIYSNKKEYLGLYRPDFLIENKIIVELKAVSYVSRQESARVYDYLRNSEYELAYLINFASPKLYMKRFLFTNDRKNPRYNPRIPTNQKTNTNEFVAIRKSFRCNLWIIFVAICGLFIHEVQAAELFFEPAEFAAPANSISEVKVFLTTEKGENINALEINVEYPAEFVKLKDWSDGNSIINLWIKKPENINNAFSFQGIIPGGYNGEKGLLMTLYFENQKEGPAEIKVKDDSKILLNDGSGTEAKVYFNTAKITISAPQKESGTVQFTENIPPEPFTPIISRSDQIYGGNYFLIFSTQDKNSGISHYEVSEGENPFEIAESPYPLRNQKLDEDVKVKAVDKAGNERIEIAPAKQAKKTEERKMTEPELILLGILLSVILVIFAKYVYTKIRVVRH